MIDSKVAITCLISAQGDPKLAAVRAAQALGEPVTEPLLLAAIAADPYAPNILYRQMQVLMALAAFSSFRTTQLVYLEKLPSMTPDTIARTYTTMLRNMTELTRTATAVPQDSSPLRAVLDALPPEIADAVERLITLAPSLDSQAGTLELLSADSSEPPGADSGCEARSRRRHNA